MAVQRGFGTIIFSIIGIVIVVLAVFVILKIVRSEPPVVPLIYKSIDLRQAENPVDRADLITNIDDLVVDLDNKEVKDQWDRMMQCLSTSCPDEAYLDMVLVAVANFEGDVPHSDVLINVIATNKYWGNDEHLLEFSKALSMANEQVLLLDNRKAEKLWEQIVECNDACSEKNGLYFDFIRAVVQ